MSKTYKTEGIIFRSLKYSETSIILDIYTKEVGLSSFIVGGVRKAKSKMVNVYHPMNIIDMVAYKGGEGLSRIKEAHYAYTYERLDRDVIRSSVGTFIIDLLRSSIQDKEVDLNLYAFIKKTLTDLDKGILPVANLPIRFSIELAAHLGFQILDNHGDETPYFDLRTGQFISDLRTEKEVLPAELSASFHALMNAPSTHTLTKEHRHVLLDRMMDYYSFHIESFKPLRSLAVLRAIMG